ncbi:MAG: hypothetical protein F6K30_21265 [Cyanothece sp. SIO2G6]|nr:hypothetical protein [Cyanothece sp. SIO2G6]
MSTPKKLSLRYWDTTQSDCLYPEVHDEHLKYKPILNRPNTGICFSGGGTVSAALVPGYLKALEELGLMQYVRYISGVSGGTWGSAPYTEPFDVHHPVDPDCACEEDQRHFGYNQIAKLFNRKIYKKENGKWTSEPKCDSNNLVHVFERSQFDALEKALTDAKAGGGPVIVKGEYTVVENKLLSVEGGWKCNVIWFCVDTSEGFNMQLPPDVRSLIGKKGSELHNFPAICTFRQNKTPCGSYYEIQLTAMQANLLSNQAYWTVKEKQDMFSSLESSGN